MKLTIVTLLMLAVVLARGEDMRKHLRDTRKLVKEGKHREALQRHLWFHDHALEHDSSMSGVRLSFALSDWKRLGVVFPPAMAELQRTRDGKTLLFENRQGTQSLFYDVVALNQTLGEDGKTVDLFRQLDREQNGLAKECWIGAKKVVIQARAFELAASHIGDLMEEFSAAKEEYRKLACMFGGKNDGGRFTRFNDDRFAKETIDLIALAMAVDDVKSAREIQKKLLALLPDKRLRDADVAKQNTALNAHHPSGNTR